MEWNKFCTATADDLQSHATQNCTSDYADYECATVSLLISQTSFVNKNNDDYANLLPQQIYFNFALEGHKLLIRRWQ